MLKIDNEVDTQEYSKHTDGYIVGVLQPALAAGVNNAAKLVQADLSQAAADIFDRPVAFTMRAFGVLLADPTNPQNSSKPACWMSRLMQSCVVPYVRLRKGGRLFRALGGSPDSVFPKPMSSPRILWRRSFHSGDGYGRGQPAGAGQGDRRARLSEHCKQVGVHHQNRDAFALRDALGRATGASVMGWLAACFR